MIGFDIVTTGHVAMSRNMSITAMLPGTRQQVTMKKIESAASVEM